jgi:hypothetical protein
LGCPGEVPLDLSDKVGVGRFIRLIENQETTLASTMNKVEVAFQEKNLVFPQILGGFVR